MKMKHFVLRIVLAQILMMVCASIASAQYIPIMAGYTNQVWRYNDTSTAASNPQGLFQAPAFDDTVAGWKTGKALFGNDDAGVYNGADDPFRGGVNGFATPLDRTGGRVTFYFRTHFNLASLPSPNATLFATNYLDDSAAWYLNGVEIGRMRLPAAPSALTWDTLGSNPPTEGIPYPITFGPEAIAAMVVGDNVLAVEVHQSSTGSSDAAFAMNLILINPFCVQILDDTIPADASVLENRSFSLKAKADASPPISYQWVHNGVDIPGATTRRYDVQRAQLSDGGNYYCRISNPVCTRYSRTNTVTVTDDTVAPLMIGAASANFTTITVQFNEGMGDQVLDSFNWGVVDGNGDPVGISDVITLSSNRSIATLTLLSGALAEDTQYTVSIGGADDLAGNFADTIEATFRTFTTAGCSGSFFWEAFDTSAVAGNAVSILTSSTNFPNNPRDIARIPTFDTRNTAAYPDDSHEQFGGRVRGLFVPTVSGPWTFYLASDDGSELWLNPSGPSSAGKQRIAYELNCCNNFLPEFTDPVEEVRPTQTSVPINLTAGQAYYIEGLYKEGGGGDWLKVAATPYGDAVPAGGNSQAGSVGATSLPGTGGPAGILSGITITGEPQSQNIVAGGQAQFTVTLSQDVPACYQWKKDGVDIPGAIGPRYKFITTIGDNNTQYSVQVSLLGGTIRNSSSATLTVFVDTIPPTVTSVAQDITGDFTVTYSEPMDLTTSTNRNNYAIDGVAPAAAVASGTTIVILTPGAPVAPCPASHTIVVQNVKDANGVTISPSPTSVPITLNNLLVLPINANQSWKYNDAGVDLGAGWEASAFDDSLWSNGAPTLAFPATEVIQAGFPVRTTLAAVRSTTYFRKHFNMPSDPSSVTNLQLNVILDDGGVFYLNGQELTRIRMAAGPVLFDQLTTAGQPGADPPQILEIWNLPPGLLQSGDNVLAARVHQSSATSSDTVFAAGIFAQATGCGAPRPRLTITRNGNQVTITSTAPGGTIYRSTTIGGPWNSVGAAPQTVTIGAGNSFFEIR